MAASSLLFWLTQPPLAFAFLPFVAFVPWWAWLKDAPAREARQSGIAFGMIYCATQMWFVMVVLRNYTGSDWIGLVPYLVIIAMGGVFFWALAAVVHFCFARRAWWLVPLVWTGSEVFRAFIGPVPFPWGILAHPLYAFPSLAQAAAGGTIFLVSAWCGAVNVLAACIFFPSRNGWNPSGNALFRMTLACCTVAILSLWRFSQAPQGEVKTVTLAQPGVNLAYLHGEERRDAVYLSAEQVGGQVLAQGPTDLVVFPEGYIPGGGFPPANPFGPKPPFPAVMGGSYLHDGRAYQGAFAWDPKAGKWSMSAKERLVIFGETMPWTSVIPYDKWLNLGFISFVPGRHQIQDVSGMKVGVAVCYEGLFSDLAARYSNEGANLLAVISIDDWYVGTPAWDLLWQSTVWRAIESGLPVARSGGLGRSLAADARGRILSLVPENRRLASRVSLTVPYSSDAFPYRMFFPWTCLASLAFAAAWMGREEWVKRKAPSPERES